MNPHDGRSPEHPEHDGQALVEADPPAGAGAAIDRKGFIEEIDIPVLNESVDGPLAPARVVAELDLDVDLIYTGPDDLLPAEEMDYIDDASEQRLDAQSVADKGDATSPGLSGLDDPRRAPAQAGLPSMQIPAAAADAHSAAGADNPRAADGATDRTQSSTVSDPAAVKSERAGVSLTPNRTAGGKTGSNPFLPQHILNRLNNGSRNLIEELAQSSAVLEASTALLRQQSKLQPRVGQESLFSGHGSEARSERSASQRPSSTKQKVIDDLVDDYMPLLAAELRRRLKRLLDE